MKRYLLPLCALALALLLASCRFETEEDPTPRETEGPLRLESLCVEVSRGSLSTQALAKTVRELPEAMKEALAAQGVEVETVTVSVGSAPAATVQAVGEGGVDLAFLPAADLKDLEDPPTLLLTAGPADREGDAGSPAAGGPAAGEPDAGEAEGPHTFAAVVRPDAEELTGEDFAAALAAAVNDLLPEQPVFGPYPYAPVEDDSPAD